jgi:transcriptional regulator with XRE-family HTH domain
MTARNALIQAPPFAVEEALKTLGANLRIARLRRKLTINEIGQKIGVGPRAVMDAEKGKPSTAIAVYVALLWALDLIDQFSEVASPARDDQGLALSLPREDSRARARGAIDNDF